jgi:ABC-2 type transport system permease protein
MRALLAVAHREYLSLFRTAVGWLVLAIFSLLCGLWVAGQTFIPGEPASLRVFFSTSHWLLLFVAPAISMRLVAEETRSGTIETLATSPASDWAIVMGKYAAALAFLLTLLVPTLAYIVTLELVADPDYGPIAAGYLGLALTGALYLGVGLFVSALTSSQIVAFLGTLLFFVLLWFVGNVGPTYAPGWLAPALSTLSLDLRLADFARGVIDTSHVVFFIAASACAASLAVVPLEWRRWR